jgi:hypothetical protein
MNERIFYKRFLPRKIFLGIFILFCAMNAAGEGSGERNSLSYDKYADYGPPKKDYYYGYGVYRSNKFNEIIQYSQGQPIVYEYNLFYYNEYYNENIQSPVRLKKRVNLTTASTNDNYISKYTVVQEKKPNRNTGGSYRAKKFSLDV